LTLVVQTEAIVSFR